MSRDSDKAKIRNLESRIERLSDLCDADHEILSELLDSMGKATALFARTPNFDAKDKTPPGYPEREPYPGAYRRGGALEAFAALRRFVIKRFGYSRDIAPLDAMCFLMMNADIGFYDPLGDPKFFDNRTRKRRSSASYQEMYYDAFLIHVVGEPPPC